MEQASGTTGRPATSKPRGVCRFYNTSRGCFNGANCKFLHGELENYTPFDNNKVCRFYAKGFCRNGDTCWFKHDVKTVSDESMEDICCICLEKPVTYGLLAGCSHIFCMHCIRQWRDPSGKNGEMIETGNTKKCPLCRAASNFITPSSQFFPQGHPGKNEVLARYKDSMSRIPCKYFEKSKSGTPVCPFGRDCFYRHENADGTPYVFSEGVDRAMKRYKANQRRRRQRADPNSDRVGFLNHVLENPLEDIGATIDAIRMSLPGLLDRTWRDYNHEHEEDEEDDHEEEPFVVGGPEDDEGEQIQSLERMADDILFQLTSWQSVEFHAHTPTPNVLDDLPPLEHIRPRPEPEVERIPGLRYDSRPASPVSDADMPSLQSISDSDDETDLYSDSDSDDEIVLEHERQRVQARQRGAAAPAVHAPLLFENPPNVDELIIDVSSDEGEDDEDEQDEMERALDGSDDSASERADSPPPLESPASTSDKLVQPEADDAGALEQRGDDHLAATLHVEHDADPPFVTDGRGRVVWSRPCAPLRQTSTKTRRAPRVDVDVEHVSGPVSAPVPATDGIVTDGRGRVIWHGTDGDPGAETSGDAHNRDAEAGVPADEAHGERHVGVYTRAVEFLRNRFL